MLVKVHKSKSNPKGYLEASLTWPLRLYTRNEVKQILRIKESQFQKLVARNYLLPLRRIDGVVHYSDWSIYRAIHFLYPEISAHHSKQIRQQMNMRRMYPMQFKPLGGEDDD